MDFSPLLTLLISSAAMILSAATAFIVAWFESRKRRLISPEKESDDVSQEVAEVDASKE